ncbi:MAG: phosphoglycerate kinase [Syntrophaceae bacterium]|nr:phosphoglycerate kinase [Syntrophaceae bacterium]
MAVHSIKDLSIRGKKVFFRFDFNVPLDSAGIVKDATRITRALPTLKYAISQGAKCIISSHLGRPKGERKPEMSLKPVAKKLSELIGQNVEFVNDCIGPEVEQAVNSLKNGDVLFLENLRFHSEETKNDPVFSAKLAQFADVYVNDAFGTAHRAHCSTVGVPELVKEKAAGFLMKEELDNLEKALSNPVKPVVAIFGGAKVSDKIEVLKNIVQRMDTILIGGGMANTFLMAQGYNMGASRIEEDMIETARQIMSSAKERGAKVVLPIDVEASVSIDDETSAKTLGVKDFPLDQMALDIGPQTVKEFENEISKAGTIVWNGPMGVFESEAFKKGTMEIANAVANSSAFSLVGGGDSVRAVHQAGVSDKISYISTGGGAFMEFMEGKTLPGVAALEG